MPFHLQTHPANRPPLQPPGNPEEKASYATSNLPPHIILRIHQLRQLSHTRFARAKALQQALQEIQTRVYRLQTEDPLPWTDDLARQWRIEQYLRPHLTQQAYRAAHHAMRTLPAATTPPPLPAFPTPEQTQAHKRLVRQHEILTNADYLAFHIFHRFRRARILLARRELADFRNRNNRHRSGWLQRAHDRWSVQQKRDAVAYLRRRFSVGEEAAWCLEVLGVETPLEYDAHGWGVGLRLRTVRGQVGKDGWPGQEWFEVYKLQRYGREPDRLEVRMPVGWEMKVAGGMWLTGKKSPLRREVRIAEDEGGRGTGVKRKHDEVCLNDSFVEGVSYVRYKCRMT